MFFFSISVPDEYDFCLKCQSKVHQMYAKPCVFPFLLQLAKQIKKLPLSQIDP